MLHIRWFGGFMKTMALIFLVSFALVGCAAADNRASHTSRWKPIKINRDAIGLYPSAYTPACASPANTATTTTLVKGPFKPPVVPTGCYAVAITPHSLTAGKRTTLVLSVHMLGKPAKNARVKVSGAGINKTSGPTNAQGIVRISVKPAKPGILRFQPVAHAGCGAPRIGVIGAFTPPVTG